MCVHADALATSCNGHVVALTAPEPNHSPLQLHSPLWRLGEACSPRPSLQQFRHAMPCYAVTCTHTASPRHPSPCRPAHPATLMLIIGVLVVIIARRMPIGCLRCATSIGLSGRASSPFERHETGIARPWLLRVVRLSWLRAEWGKMHLDAPPHRPLQSHDAPSRTTTSTPSTLDAAVMKACRPPARLQWRPRLLITPRLGLVYRVLPQRPRFSAPSHGERLQGRLS